MRAQGSATVRYELCGPYNTTTTKGWVEVGPSWVYVELPDGRKFSLPRERVHWVEWA